MTGQDEQQIRHDLSNALWACLRDGGGFTSAAMEIVQPLIAERDAAVARADAAEQAVQRVRAVVDEWGDADPDRPNHGLWIAIRRALDGTP